MSGSAALVENGRVVGVVCFGPGMVEHSRTPDGEQRWCFSCRARRTFCKVVDVPAEPSYYGPAVEIRCDVCGQPDGDLFPGRSREWVEADW